MWTEIPVGTTRIDCRRPYSFYFDLIVSVWKSPTQPSSNLPLHRICTLARKMGAQSIIMESATSIPNVREEIDDFDAANGGGGSAEAIAITFFSKFLGEESLEDLNPSELLGQVIVINYKSSGSQSFSHTYVYESKFRLPEVKLSSGKTTKLLNNYVHCGRSLDITVEGATYSLHGVYYAQQNQITSVCAHACLKMSLNTVGAIGLDVTTRSINQLLSTTPPVSGLQISQVEQVISNSGHEPVIYNCSAGSPDEYLQVLHSILDSGFSALLVFTTKGGIEHVVYVCGHTLNTDEWHPQALPAYSGAPSAQYYAMTAWVDHLIVHDDNFGPYYSLSSKSFVVDPDVQAKWIIGILPMKVTTLPLIGQLLSTVYLSHVLPWAKSANIASGRWFDYMASGNWKLVMRTTLMERDRYISHLANLQAHDRTRLTNNEVIAYKYLPDSFWCTEFTLPNLFTGNRAKLGEVFIDAFQYDKTKPLNSVLGMRGPSFMVLPHSPGKIQIVPSSICSHAPFYRVSDHDHEW